MCNFMSGLFFRNGDIFCATEYTDSHEILKRAAGAGRASMVTGELEPVPWEYTPPEDLKLAGDLSKWTLKVDQQTEPTWWDTDKVRAYCERRVEAMFVREPRGTVLGGCWICLGKKATIQELICGKIVIAEGSRFDRSSFVDSSFDRSSFVDSRFEGSRFDRSSFVGSRFVDSSFVDSSFDRSSFVGSRFDRSSFVGSRFEGSRFDRSSFVGSRFDRSSFDRSSFVGSRFDSSSFVDSRFDRSSFVDSSFVDSRFEDSRFERSSFVDSSFDRSSFVGSRFEGSSFEGSYACVETILQTNWKRSESGLIVPDEE
jgi:uncharacterized protein YjbI with pentapeptide repeats